ncbi:MAG: hypothetical protein RML72_10265 [Bacteroidia bacterium]|nr:hypothetical protein [Bacteroidia bacterium]MDW8159242.1 hypothetical protein [Bacteroidia bacterium]
MLYKFKLLVLLIILWGTSSFLRAQDIKGVWYDAQSQGYYEFMEDGEFFFHTPDGKISQGTLQELERDKEGNRQFMGKIKFAGSQEESNVFLKFYVNGKAGYMQYRCTKYHFFRFENS